MKKGAMTEGSLVESEALPRRSHIAMLFAWWIYIPLVVLFLCLWVLDAETWFQRALLLFLALAATFLLWLCLSGLTDVDEERRANAMKSNQKKRDEVGKKLRALP